MSRQVDLSKPLSEDDRKFLEDRDRVADIARADGVTIEEVINNLNNFGTSAGRSAVEAIDDDAASKGGRQPEEGTEEWVESLTVAQLKEEITKRDPDASVSGNKGELQDTLLDILADEE